MEVAGNTCQICSFKFTSLRQPISCLSADCGETACSSCLSHYVASDESRGLQCMFCKIPIPIDYLYGKVSSAALNRFRVSIWKSVMVSERESLKATMPLVEREKRKRSMMEESDALADEIAQKRKQRQQILNEIANIENNVSMVNVAEYTCKCPTDDCRGFVSAETSCCGLCNNSICPSCLEPNSDVHSCDPSKVSSISHINATSKPCPTCTTRITRSFGCDHMFCTNCNTGFSWNSGLKIPNSVNTNPYYYQWLRANPDVPQRAPGDVRCGGLPSLTTALRRTSEEIIPHAVLTNIYRCINHTQRIELDHFRPMDDNSDLRVSFLLGDIDESKWADTVKKRLKKRDIQKEIFNSLEWFVDTTTDCIIFMCRDNTTEDQKVRIAKQLDGVRNLFNRRMIEVAEIFKNLTPSVTEFWEFVRS